MSDVDRVNPDVLLPQWDVQVESLDRLEPGLDAVACWGTNGPAVLINPAGLHARSAESRAATLAHEIGHLIMDRRRSLPLAEVFGGATPLRLEQRARAFAAELLLPRAFVALTVVRSSSLMSAAASLSRSHGVSREVIGWQIKNGSAWESLKDHEREEVKRWNKRWILHGTDQVPREPRRAGLRGRLRANAS